MLRGKKKAIIFMLIKKKGIFFYLVFVLKYTDSATAMIAIAIAR